MRDRDRIVGNLEIKQQQQQQQQLQYNNNNINNNNKYNTDSKGRTYRDGDRVSEVGGGVLHAEAVEHGRAAGRDVALRATLQDLANLMVRRIRSEKIMKFDRCIQSGRISLMTGANQRLPPRIVSCQ
jgi:hypothetical protein